MLLQPREVGERGGVGVKKAARLQEKQTNGEPGACSVGSVPGSRAWQPIVGQMGFRGAQVLGKSMPTTGEQSWIKLGWMRIGTEMTYMNYEEAVRTRSEEYTEGSE